MSETIVEAYSLDKRADVAKQSIDETDQLISEFMPFLNTRAAKYSSWLEENQYETIISAAMMAFYEAIQKYDIAKGHFFPFANNIVCNRIIDSIRQLKRDTIKTIPLENEDEDGNISAQSAVISELSIHMYEKQRRQKQLADEIEQFKAELRAWGISMDALVKSSPKHQKLRKTYNTVVLKILDVPDIIQTIQIKRYFPIKAVVGLTGLSHKTLERARVFILASLLIKIGDYEYLSDYVNSGH